MNIILGSSNFQTHTKKKWILSYHTPPATTRPVTPKLRGFPGKKNKASLQAETSEVHAFMRVNFPAIGYSLDYWKWPSRKKREHTMWIHGAMVLLAVMKCIEKLPTPENLVYVKGLGFAWLNSPKLMKDYSAVKKTSILLVGEYWSLAWLAIIHK